MNTVVFALSVFWIPVAFGLAGLALYAMGRRDI